MQLRNRQPSYPNSESDGHRHSWKVDRVHQSMQYDAEGRETGWLHSKLYICELCGKSLANHQHHPHSDEMKDKVNQ